MSIEKINKITSSLMNHFADSEKLALPLLAIKARKALNSYPDDPTLMSMASVLGRMSDKQMFISRGELQNLYRGFYTRNNQFAEIFSHELGKTAELKGPTLAKRAEEGTVETDFEKFVDPVLANGLRSAFDKNEPLKEYSDKVAAKAQEQVALELKLMGLAADTKVLGGNPHTILVVANFETPKGPTSVYVPVEITDNKVLSPSFFVSNAGVVDFNRLTLAAYVTKNAGKTLEVSANQMLGYLTRVAQGEAQISNVELAVTKMNATHENVGDFAGGIINQQLDGEIQQKDLALPTYQDQEISSFAERFDSPTGRASFKFGQGKVSAARAAVVGELRSFGYSDAQVAVADCNEDTVVYAVNLGKTAFTVPCKMSGNVVPNIFICNGSLKELNRANINALMQKEATDFRAAAAASPLYNIKPSDLINVIRSATSEGNLARAEDALNVLAQAGDAKAYQIGFASYMGGLSKTASVTEAPAEEPCRCSRIIRNAHSKFEICGHTGLPLHKVYQDRNGDCHPGYRKGMDETYEGGYFMNSKIFG